MIAVQVCISGSSATVSLENGLQSMVGAWDGSSFAPIAFPAFTTAANAYPAYMVSGQLNGGMLDITVSGGGETSMFSIPSAGGGGACPPI